MKWMLHIGLSTTVFLVLCTLTWESHDHLLQKDASVMRAESYTNLWVQRKRDIGLSSL